MKKEVVKKDGGNCVRNIRKIYLGVSMEYHQSIRRPRPNSMKLSGFVELVSLIILIIKFLKFDFAFKEI
jgi:hypothetical protein